MFGVVAMQWGPPGMDLKVLWLLTFGAETPPPSDVRLVVGRPPLHGYDLVGGMVCSGQPETIQFSNLICYIIL